MVNATPPVIDYEGSTYRTDFWEGRGRAYEDRVERAALFQLLPRMGGRRLLEIGAGFGRLTPEYHPYEQVVVMDYSLSHVQDAQQRLGRDARFVYVAADVYRLPFAPGVFDAATMVRVLHHIQDVPRALAQVRRVLAPKGVFVLEHANKRNLKAMLRYAMGAQAWNPYDPAPYAFVPLNYDFHPATVASQLGEAGFEVVRRVPVSWFRLGVLKRAVPTGLLVALDRALHELPYFVTPSVFVKAVAVGDTPGRVAVDVPLGAPERLLAAPETGAPLRRDGDVLVDAHTGARYAIRDGVYDLRAPLDV